jgi:hypothetical protein
VHEGDPSATPESADSLSSAVSNSTYKGQVPVVLERAYIETPDTCDAFVTRGLISQQPQATLEVTSERWEIIA